MATSSQGYQRQIHTPSELGSVISELRSHRRKTQFEVASALAIDRSQLAHLEGGRSGRYLAHLLNILDHLGAELQIHWSGDLASQPADQPADQGPPSQLDPSFALSPAVPADSFAPRSNGTLQSATASGPASSVSPASPHSAISSVMPITPASPVSPRVGPPVVPPISEAATKAPSNPVVRTGTLFLNETYRPDGPMVSNDDAPDQPGAEAKDASADRTAQSTTESTVETTVDSTIEPTVEALPEAMTGVEESTSTQLTKITTLAMNVMAASQQLSGQPRSSR